MMPVCRYGRAECKRYDIQRYNRSCPFTPALRLVLLLALELGLERDRREPLVCTMGDKHWSALQRPSLKDLVGATRTVGREHVVGRDAAVVRSDRASVDHVLRHLVNRPRAEEPHVHLKLVLGGRKRIQTSLERGGSSLMEPHLEDLERMVNAWLAVCAVGKDQRPANANRLGSERDRLENVGRAPDAAVDVDFKLGWVPELSCFELADDLDEDLEAGSGKVELTAAAEGKHSGKSGCSAATGGSPVAAVPVIAEDDAGEARLGGHDRVLSKGPSRKSASVGRPDMRHKTTDFPCLDALKHDRHWIAKTESASACSTSLARAPLTHSS